LHFLRWDYKDQFYNTSNGTYSSFYSYDAQGNRTRKVIDKDNIIETRYYLDGFEFYRREVNGAIDYERTTLNISDNEKVFVRVEKKTNEPEVVRYQYDNHLGSACLELDYTGRIISYEEYHPFGTTSYRSGRSETEVSLKRYKYCGKERDEQTGFYYYGMRYYAGWLCRFVSVDPLQFEYPGLTPYAYCENNPIKYIDPDGRRPIPLNDTYKQWYVKVDSWFGPRNSGIKGASTYHKGLDFNYSGGGHTDYGAPILATHEGTVTIKDNPSGSGGRSVVITSPDGSFRTRYFHLSKILVRNNQYVSESYNIAEMGGSAYGKERHRLSHLHYEIQQLVNGKWVSIDPTGNQGNTISNIIDPQKWITSNDTIYGGILQEVTVTATAMPQTKPDSIPLLQEEKPNDFELSVP
jgi:RHS repeat-associated protein